VEARLNHVLESSVALLHSDKLALVGFIAWRFAVGTIMKFNNALLSVVALVVALTALTACNKAPARTDSQTAAEVQARINSDSKIASRDIGVQAANGVVTLSGNVGSEVERASAAGDAATVDGVKTVVNNLMVEEAQATPPPAVEPGVSTPLPSAPGKKPSRHATQVPSKVADNGGGVGSMTDGNEGGLPKSQPTPPPEPVVAQAPAPPPPPKKVQIPAGTQLTIRLNDPLDSERNHVGDSFHATLGVPIVIDDETAIPSGADVVGRIVDVKSAGRFAGNSVLTLELNSLSTNGRTYNIQTSQWSRQGKGEGKNTAIKAGGGAAIGAIIGGLAGGGKGAAIGTAAGAGAGTGVAATKKGEPIKLGPESTLSFLLISPLTVMQQSANNHNAGRTPLQ